MLERRLSPFDAAAIIVANVIGGGILFRSPAVAAAIPDPVWFLCAWAAGGVLAFMGAMAYAELAALRPKAGGEYVYLREAYGPLAGFLTGWTSFVAGFSGAIAASAVFFIVTLDRFVPGIANGDALLAIPVPLTPIAFTFSIHTLTASALIVLFAIIHILGVGPGRAASNVLTTLKILAFVVFILFGLSAGTGSPANLTGAVGPVTLTGWLFAMIPVMFTYSGWNAASYMAEEIRDPGRNVPKALILGTAGVVVIYLLINVLYLYVIPIGELGAARGSVLDVVADRLLGQRAGNIMAVVALVGLAAGINAWTFAGPRVYFAMARDGLFFRRTAAINRHNVPAAALIAQAIWTVLLTLPRTVTTDPATGAVSYGNVYTQLLEYIVSADLVFYVLLVVAVIVLRKKQPEAERPYRMWGYPAVPVVSVLLAAFLIVDLAYLAPTTSGIGYLFVLTGIPVYFVWRRGFSVDRTA